MPKARSDVEIIDAMKAWMARDLPCVAGRREYSRGRYMVRNASRMSVPMILADYKAALARGEAVACLFVFNDVRFYEGRADTAETFHFLAQQMELIAGVSACELANGAALTTAIELRCPVTGQTTVFDDFECIAFCPQSDNRADPLYDPLMYAPYPCVNMSSDVYAFSRFVADSALAAWRKPVREESDIDRIARLFEVCVDRWQRVATRTIANFADITDTSLCPVHVTADQTHWIAKHKDPAFAEQKKEVHSHELPVLYGERITKRWLDFFGGANDYVAAGLARDGRPVSPM
ncbi:MAG: hypothetical protein R3D45_10915 [Rhizobiaceae bacterium]